MKLSLIFFVLTFFIEYEALAIHSEIVLKDLDHPVSIIFAPSGEAFVAEKESGRIWVVTDVSFRARQREESLSGSLDLRSRDDKSFRDPLSFRAQRGISPEKKLVTQIKDIDGRSERGLLSLALHPHWSQGVRRLFAYYTYRGEEAVRQRVVAFELDEKWKPKGEMKIILDNLPAGPPGHLNHDGGPLLAREEMIGEEKRVVLYIHDGDNAIGQLWAVWPHPSQLVQWLRKEASGKLFIEKGTKFPKTESCPEREYTLHGKVLRVLEDGTPPGDNPVLKDFMGNNSTSDCSPIFAWGLRNGFGLGFHPITGDLWDTENGNVIADEINLIEKGGNYGWPCLHGTTLNDDDPGPPGAYSLSKGVCAEAVKKGFFTDPTFVDPGAPGVDTSPGYAGLGFVGKEKNPYGKDYEGNLFWTSSDGRIFRGILKSPNFRKFEKVDITWYRGTFPVDIEQGPDGYLYFVEFGKGTLERLVPE